VLRGDGTVGIQLGGYDAGRALVIDPVLTYSTYLGGSGNDRGYGIAVDSADNTYVTGTTASTSFPISPASVLTAYPSAFVVKLNAAGNALVYVTILGGSGDTTGRAIAVDGSGNAYVAGSTTATNLPTAGPFQGSNHGGSDAFVAKLNAAGNGLVYSTYLGGSGDDFAFGLALDGTAAVIVGQTSSTDFPTAAAVQATNAGGSDAFVARLDSSGATLTFATYLGGAGADSAQGAAVNAAGTIAVVGTTASANFHLAVPLQNILGGTQDAFVAQFTAAGALTYSTYLGGSDVESGNGIAVDSAGDAYVTGQTFSSDFPTTSFLYRSYTGVGNGLVGNAYKGIGDAFVTKLNATGSALDYSEYLGGSSTDSGNGIALNADAEAQVVGTTYSADFPVANLPSAGGPFAFVARFNLDGTALDDGTFLGGSAGNWATAVAVDAAGHTFVTGYTTATDFPTANPAQPANGGGEDAFVAKVPNQRLYFSSTGSLTLRGSGDNLQVLRDGVLVVTRPLAQVIGVEVRGDQVTIDDSAGLFTFPYGITNFGGPLTVFGTPGADTVSLSVRGNDLGATYYMPYPYQVVVDGVQTIDSDSTVTASGDGTDNATLGADHVDFLHDFSGFTGSPRHGVFSLGTLTAQADGFGEIYGNATSATLYDSAGDDTFAGSSLWGPGYSLGTSAQQIQVFGSTGNDVAYLRDTELKAQPGYAHAYEEPQLIVHGLYSYYSTEVFNFGTVRATGNSRGGADLYDSVGDDIFVATPTYAYMAGTGYLVVATGYGRVSGYSTAGHDVAFLFDSPGDDLFRGTPTTSFLAGTGFLNAATGFFRVFAFAGAGGNDLAEVYDGPGDDVFQGQGPDALLFGPGYWLLARNFSTVRAFATAGGNDQLFLGAVDYAFGQYGTWL
jgi:hypothetical protein